MKQRKTDEVIKRFIFIFNIKRVYQNGIRMNGKY